MQASRRPSSWTLVLFSHNCLPECCKSSRYRYIVPVYEDESATEQNVSSLSFGGLVHVHVSLFGEPDCQAACRSGVAWRMFSTVCFQVIVILVAGLDTGQANLDAGEP